MSFHWTCPFCQRDTTITDTIETFEYRFKTENTAGYRRFAGELIVCPKPKCRMFTFSIDMFDMKLINYAGGSVGWQDSNKLLNSWRLIPPSIAKVFPEYVPKAIRDDYVEACAICELSPKASATLSRRCLQGMIRDFWKTSKTRLVDEIEAINDKVDPDTWAAIDAVRKIGNIGAHMEKDINVIVDVEPGESQKLIELIELLVKDWYITRHQRKESLKAIVAVKDAKDAEKTTGSKVKP
jgi:hypothetical protein